MVRFTAAERQAVRRLIHKPRVAAPKVRRARALLNADADGPHWPDAKIAEAFDGHTKSVEDIRRRPVTERLEIACHGRPERRARGEVLDGEQGATIIALRLGRPPKGFANWALRLLAERAVPVEAVESVSRETVRRRLKKGG